MIYQASLLIADILVTSLYTGDKTEPVRECYSYNARTKSKSKKIKQTNKTCIVVRKNPHRLLSFIKLAAMIRRIPELTVNSRLYLF